MTAERWRRSLVGMGLDVHVLAAESLAPGDMKGEISRFNPDLIHVHNVFRAGGVLRQRALAHAWGCLPLVVSPSGTDMNIESRRESGKDIVGMVLKRADAIIVQSREGRERLAEIVSGRMNKVFFVPKSFIWLGEEPSKLRNAACAGADDVLFFMPAGIRPVKGNLECLVGFEKVHALRPQAKIVFAGPALDGDYTDRFHKEIKRLQGFARWIPPIAPAAMRSAYASSDIVLNASFSEGLSNVLLEGKAAGKPLLAADIPGNRWPVLGDSCDAPMGILFDPKEPDDFVRKALLLIDDADLRRKLGATGAAYASRMPGPGDEARALIAVYETALLQQKVSESLRVEVSE